MVQPSPVANHPDTYLDRTDRNDYDGVGLRTLYIKQARVICQELARKG